MRLKAPGLVYVVSVSSSLDGDGSWHRECGGVVGDVRHELPCVGLSKLPEEPEAASVVPSPLIITLPPTCV